jgi:uncharacterized metal-binding protein YceD (DUF177 family)
MAEKDSGWTHLVEVATLPPDGLKVALETDAGLRKRLAEYAGVANIPALEARLKVMPDGDDGAHVSGELTGSVRQTCVVSLEEFDNAIRETVDVFFAEQAEPSKPADGEEDEAFGEDGPDPIIGGKIDLGALAAEFLLLAIDPYPRKPGVVFRKPADGVEDVPESKSPFDALSALKTGPKKSG